MPAVSRVLLGWARRVCCCLVSLVYVRSVVVLCGTDTKIQEAVKREGQAAVMRAHSEFTDLRQVRGILLSWGVGAGVLASRYA